MSMRFTPKSEKEINEEKLLPEGEYPFEISGAVNHTSAAGNASIKLTVRVYKPNGQFILVDDYLSEKVLYKVLHCCQACGLEETYNTGLLEPDMFIGKTGMLKLKQDAGTEKYSAKNSVKDYIKDAGKVTLPKDNLAKVLDNTVEDDDIPF